MLITKLKLTLGLAALTAVTALAQTQTNAPATATAAPAAATPAPTAAELNRAEWDKFLTDYEKWRKEIKNPAPWFSWGADVRLRNEYMDNALTLSDNAPRHEQDYFRFRERIWASVMPVTNVSANVRLAAEEREWSKPSNAGQFGPRSGFEERYGIVDNAYLKVSNIGNQPLTFSGGRQDIALGDPDDWWLVMDGTPGDGSWTFFLDSLRATYDAKDIKTKMDVIYIYQDALPDGVMPTIGESSGNTSPLGKRPYYLTEQNEQGAIIYLSNKSVKDMQIDGYFIYKGDHRTDTTLIKNGDNADIFTVGSKITGTPTEHWFYSAEAAYQFGSKQDSNVLASYYVPNRTERRDISAYAGKAKLTYLFKDKMQNQVSLVGEFLSGDNPNTKNQDEMFDVLWGRYPRWTELGTWNYATETGGRYLQMNNTGRVGPNWNITPIKGVNFNAMYNALFAPENTPTRDASIPVTGKERFSDNGNFRGHYLQGILKYQISKSVAAQIKGEVLWEGDYYAQRDLMSFLRTELTFVF